MLVASCMQLQGASTAVYPVSNSGFLLRFLYLQTSTGKIESNPLSEIEQIVRMSRVSRVVEELATTSNSSIAL